MGHICPIGRSRVKGLIRENNTYCINACILLLSSLSRYDLVELPNERRR